MELGLAFKFLHIVAAIIWIGGGFALLVAVEVVAKKRGAGQSMAIVDAVALLGPGFFVPVSLLTVIFGALAAWFGPGFSTLWVNLGFVGFAATFLNGLLLIKPRAEAIAALAEKEGPNSPKLIAPSRTLVTIARFDYVMLFLVVADMVYKPSLSDVWVLVAMAVVLVAGAIWVFSSVSRQQVTAA